MEKRKCSDSTKPLSCLSGFLYFAFWTLLLQDFAFYLDKHTIIDHTMPARAVCSFSSWRKPYAKERLRRNNESPKK
jgi:hypothetical protein